MEPLLGNAKEEKWGVDVLRRSLLHRQLFLFFGLREAFSSINLLSPISLAPNTSCRRRARRPIFRARPLPEKWDATTTTAIVWLPTLETDSPLSSLASVIYQSDADEAEKIGGGCGQVRPDLET